MAPPPSFKLHAIYSAVLLFIEPLSAVIGAYYAHFRPLEYLQLTDSASSPTSLSSLPLSTQVTLSQLANLYLLFAINEALILRSTSDLRVWKTLLFGLLLADFGQLYSVKELGISVYWDVRAWNKMDWGNVGFVYAAAAMRLCFLFGVGMGGKRAVSTGVKKGR